MLQRVKKVYGFELVEEAVEDARHNAQVNGILALPIIDTEHHVKRLIE